MILIIPVKFKNSSLNFLLKFFYLIEANLRYLMVPFCIQKIDHKKILVFKTTRIDFYSTTLYMSNS